VTEDKQESKKSKFLKGALVLAIAGILCRVLGVIFRIPLTNIVGNFGMGLYQMVFPLYALLLIVSSAGVPVAISKMIARKDADIKKILINALILLGAIGLVFSALFAVFSHPIAAMQGNKDVGIIYIAIAPSVFLVCLISAFRGYFQGLQNMIPTAVSQLIEQGVKMAVGITLALILIDSGVVWAVFGAILAVTVSELIALVYLIIHYFVGKKKQVIAREEKQSRKLFDKKIMKEIIKQSLPITAMASIFPLILVFDSMVIINLLKVAGSNAKEATQLFGIQSGAVHTLINLPAVIGVALATAVVPAISKLLKLGQQKEMRTHAGLAVKLSVLVSIFFVVFYLFFAHRIIDLLYHDAFSDNEEHFKIASNLLKIESAMILLMGISMVFSAMLQAADRSKLPLIALGIGGGVKVIFELIFITTKMGIYAVSISNVLCFAIAAVLNTIFALRTFKLKGKFMRVALKVLALSAGYLLVLWVLGLVIPEGRWWLILIGALGTVFFGIFVFLLKMFDKSEKKVFNLLRSS
jgi:stage V sporulation protein B